MNTPFFLDLETNQCNGAGMRRARPLQHVFPSLQVLLNGFIISYKKVTSLTFILFIRNNNTIYPVDRHRHRDLTNFPQHILPRNQNQKVMPREERWDHGNCSEMNTWTHLNQVKPKTPVRTLTIKVAGGQTKYPCRNCRMCHVNFLIN